MEEYHSLDWLNDDDDAGDFGAQVVWHVPQAVAETLAAPPPPPAVTHGWLWHLFYPGHKDT